MRFKNVRLVLIVLALGVVLAGCSISVGTKTKTSPNTTNGIFVSENQGETFKTWDTVIGQGGGLGGANINNLLVDPTDAKALYTSAALDGLYYSFNIAQGWQRVNNLPSGLTINSITVDPLNKCRIYISTGNKVLRSDDCLRSWAEVYNDNDVNLKILTVAVDHFDDNNVYIGTSRGEVIKSLDAGKSWHTIQRFDKSVLKLVIDPKDSRAVFTVTNDDKLYLFNSGHSQVDDMTTFHNTFDGINWVDLNANLADFQLGGNFRSLLFCASDKSLFLASDKVIVKSLDNGRGWAKLKLITPDNATTINALAVNPQDCQQIFYITNTTLYKTLDGAQNWITKSLPSSVGASTIALDFNNPKILYLGMKAVVK